MIIGYYCLKKNADVNEKPKKNENQRGDQWNSRV